jgi:hypothetical protein
MIFKDDNEAIQYLKANQKVSEDFVEMRKYSKELKALVNGEDFIDELICKIEHLENDKKALARAKYSRSIKDLFSRLFQPIDNIYYASGGVKEYDISNQIVKTNFLKQIANIRDNKSLSEWVQTYAVQLYNTDPNGVLFLEYKTEPKIDVYPTYKSIGKIRYYKEKGQTLEYIIFEPKVKNKKTYWRIVDDLTDRTFEQVGNNFVLVPEKTFKHPFGQVPALICSNIQLAGEDEKLAPIDSIVDIAKEYARDQSFLTLYKIYKGNPIFWRYVQYCSDCSGTGKQENNSCSTCNGMGKIVAKSDVTDAVELPIPTDQESPVIAPNIAGFISPDLDVWTKYEETLKLLEEQIYKSHWGTSYGMQNVQGMKTATEVTFDKQPLENQLNKYADFIEYIEWKFSEWILNLLDAQKTDKSESKITINLGRRYIIESYDVLLERYEKSVLAEENSVVLDKLFTEYLGAKYRNNPIDLQINLLKARIEPYLHLSLTKVKEIFGNEEAQRKVLFGKWWQSLTNYSQDEAKLLSDFNKWFEENKKVVNVTN